MGFQPTRLVAERSRTNSGPRRAKQEKGLQSPDLGYQGEGARPEGGSNSVGRKIPNGRKKTGKKTRWEVGDGSRRPEKKRGKKGNWVGPVVCPTPPARRSGVSLSKTNRQAPSLGPGKKKGQVQVVGVNLEELTKQRTKRFGGRNVSREGKISSAG